MASNFRSEARNVILRLRRYRDRIQEITATTAGTPAPRHSDREKIVAQRQIRLLKTNLEHDTHECAVSRKRMVQTGCEHDFLWPALQEASAAIDTITVPAVVDGRSSVALCAAQTSIERYLTQLEKQWPTL